jgi:hypothetical protein
MEPADASYAIPNSCTESGGGRLADESSIQFPRLAFGSKAGALGWVSEQDVVGLSWAAQGEGWDGAATAKGKRDSELEAPPPAAVVRGVEVVAGSVGIGPPSELAGRASRVVPDGASKMPTTPIRKIPTSARPPDCVRAVVVHRRNSILSKL